MKLKKILAGFVAAAMAVTTMAVSAFAATVELDSDYPGAWGASAAISKADLQAVGGDVKVTLNVTPKLLIKDQVVLRPFTALDTGWKEVIEGITSETECRKPDGFIVIKKSATTVTFVIDSNAIESLADAGLQFQVNNVTVNSAVLEAGTPYDGFKSIDDKFAKDYSNEDKTYEELYPDSVATEETEAPAEEAAEETEAEAVEETAEEVEETEAVVEETVEEVEAVEETVEETEAAPAETEAAPAADTTTAPAATGNTAAATIAVVMVAAGAAALVSKRK